MKHLIKAGVFRAAQLTIPGRKWGKWVIRRDSLVGYLEKQANQPMMAVAV